MGGTEVGLAAGESVTVRLAASAGLSLYTVTSARPGELAWTVEYLDARGATVGREERVAETYVWAGQTRVFRVRRGGPVTASAVRFTAVTGCVLTQLEFIEEDRDEPPSGQHRRQDEH